VHVETVPPTRCARLLLMMLALSAPASGCGPVADALACGDRGCDFSRDEWRRVESLTNLGEPPVDKSNKYLDNKGAIDLGHRFYFSTDFCGEARWEDMLGRTTPSAREARGVRMKISCASCHDPGRAGSDFTSSAGQVSEGAGWYDVNGQQVFNAAHFPLLYWNGRSDSLWSQAAAVMESPVSMNGNRVAIVRTVIEGYKAEYDAVFGDTLPATADLPPDGKPGDTAGCQMGSASEPFGDAFDCLSGDLQTAVNFAFSNITKAIAAYESKLVSHDAPFDQYVAGDDQAISPAAVRGLRLFVGRAACIDCHRTPLLSDGRFHNIGVPQRGPGVPTEADCPKDDRRCDCVSTSNSSGVVGETCLPWGYHFGLVALNRPRNRLFRRDGPFSDDAAAAALTHGELYEAATSPPSSARGAWRTPSLRDVAQTAPYMHDGIYRTLDEVVWHYDQGGTGEAPGTKAPEVHPLLLTNRDRADLVEFLRSLTGVPLHPRRHVPPEAP
jgi:cytochrome c peroxidase